MAKPVLFAIDDDISVLDAVVEDLRRRYGKDYRILRAASGQAAVDICRELKDRGDDVALFLSDQRMPGMTGVELLQRVMVPYPHAKRVLLTAYADTEAAIRAINSARIHYYLNKPWDPPDEKLYPVLDDLLQSWKADREPRFDGLRVVGTRWSPADHAIRQFLSRNLIPFQWITPETNPEILRQLCERGLDDSKLPVVLLPDGSSLVQPEISTLAARVGLRTTSANEFYDVVVVGAGPAGLAAGVYGASEGLRTLIVEAEAPGGQAGSSSRIENYLGFAEGISGEELAKRSFLQAQRLGAEFLTQRVTSLRSDGPYHLLTMADGREISCLVCVIATGVSYRMLEIPGADRLSGAGVYYGAAQTEANSCRNATVHLVGGANSAGQAAMYFARYASSVKLLVRAPSLEKSMSKYLIDQIARTPQIEVLTDTEIVRLDGDTHLEQITLRSPAGDKTCAATDLFVFIGAAPKTEWLPAALARDPKGFIFSGPDLMARCPKRWPLQRDPFLLETSLPGVFVAGDVRFNSVKRCASAVGEGSIAIQFVHQYLASLPA